MRKKWRDFWQDQFYISDWKDIYANPKHYAPTILKAEE